MSTTAANHTPALRLQDLVKRFGGLLAVNRCSFDVAQGSITGMLGPNGAGKTTVFNLIAGVVPADEGEIRYQGHGITGMTPDQIARRGLARTFQIPRVFARMTVWENLMLAPLNQPGEGIWRALVRGQAYRQKQHRYAAKAAELLSFVELHPLRNEYANTLSGGQRKLLELARVLMIDPDLVLLDEPTAGVNPALAKTLIERVLELNQQGITFLIIEHNVELIMSLCNRVVVMHHGRTLAAGRPEVVRRDPRVLAAYLGG
jgi:branched-chain amino acid transport system ATP-binding protein